MDELRERYEKYLMENGIKQSYISQITGIHQVTLSRFRKSIQNLGYQNYKILDEYLESKGY